MAVSLTTERGTRRYTNLDSDVVEGHVILDLLRDMDIESVTVKLEGIGHYKSQLTAVGISKTKIVLQVHSNGNFSSPGRATEAHKVHIPTNNWNDY
jgi:hypothetical protein